jgi:hypothetical protein
VIIKGKNFDGHDFLYEAFLKGAAAAVVSEGKYRNLPLIVVQDTLKVLHDMASYYIRSVLVNAKVIAITGSVGKTTTKDMGSPRKFTVLWNLFLQVENVLPQAVTLRQHLSITLSYLVSGNGFEDLKFTNGTPPESSGDIYCSADTH